MWEKNIYQCLVVCQQYAKSLPKLWKRTKVIFHLYKFILINLINFYILFFLAKMNTELCQIYTTNLIQKSLAASHSIVHSNMLNPKNCSLCDAVVQIRKIKWNLTGLDKWAHYQEFPVILRWQLDKRSVLYLILQISHHSTIFQADVPLGLIIYSFPLS